MSEMRKRRTVIITDLYDTGEILLVLKVDNYNSAFRLEVKAAREAYEENDNEEKVLEDYILEAIQNAGYEYTHVGFEEVAV
jgi:hypothetical protein